jgi:Holliday junction DNA helicase RuvA
MFVMIGRLSGTLIEKLPPQVVVDVNGVGYEVDVPMTTFYQLPALGQKTTLFTHLVVREDAHLLFGFASKEERQTFRQLIKVSGIGAKIALAILSGMTADELAVAIASEDIKRCRPCRASARNCRTAGAGTAWQAGHRQQSGGAGRPAVCRYAG